MCMNISTFTAQIHAKAGVLRIANKHDASYYTVTTVKKRRQAGQVAYSFCSLSVMVAELKN